MSLTDYGSALVGKNTIDLYVPTRAMMSYWGSRDVTIELLELGSYQDSLKISAPRDGPRRLHPKNGIHSSIQNLAGSGRCKLHSHETGRLRIRKSD